MSDSYDGGESSSESSVESGSTNSIDSGDDVSAFSESEVADSEGIEAEDDVGKDNGNSNILEGDDQSPFEQEESHEITKESETEHDDKSPFESSLKQDSPNQKADDADKKDTTEETDYSRPTHWRSGMKDQVWENAKDEHGRVRDPVTGRYMSKNSPWEMGHKPGYEFRKHQESARIRGISRKEFLDEYFNSDHLRPELPSSNRSHKGEDVTDNYFGD